MPPQVFDATGVQRDWTWLRERYGNVQFLDAGAGQKFRLARVDETEGPAVIKVRVVNSDGVPQANQPVANHWPDPNLSDLRDQGLQTLWRDRAVFQYTEMSGFTGFGLGTGSYIHDLQEGGPHVVWVLSPSLPSDGMSGIGMLGGTNHKGPLYLTFQTGEDPAPAGSLRDVLLSAGEREQLIRFNPQAALQRRIVLDGFFPNSNEFIVDWDGAEYIGQRAEDMVSGEVRVYYVPRDRWDDVRFEVR